MEIKDSEYRTIKKFLTLSAVVVPCIILLGAAWSGSFSFVQTEGDKILATFVLGGAAVWAFVRFFRK